ncbi:MAG: putative rRNA maturation factor [Akkermansiaceae bacterium]|jgi:probable rRNA maturation factor
MVEIYSACESREISEEFLGELQRGWSAAFQLLRGIGVGKITTLEGMEITLLDDAEMARLHGEFLNDATTTDVITFEHGELLIGVEVAARQAGEFGSLADREIALYGIHGMLHLAGFDDRSSTDAKEMAVRQEEVLSECFPLRS